MDSTGFKDIIRKLSVFKDYSSLLVPVVIVLVAVLLFIPTELVDNKLKDKIAKESVIKRGDRVKSFLSKTAVSSGQWRVEQEYQLAHERDARQTALLASQSSRRQLLSYNIFPEPKDTSALIFDKFGKQFRGHIDKLLARLNARDCPTEAELGKYFKGSSSFVQGRGKVSKGTSEIDAAIKDALCREKAESGCVYANTADLSGYEFWEEYKYDVGMKESVEDCWYWQLAYWIIEDIIDTIDALNSGSNSVFESPVKRLMAVNFGAKDKASRSGRKGASDKPSYVPSAAEGLTEPFTRRFCNDDIDVVHFRTIVVVGAEAVLPFMEQLCSAKQHKFRGFFDDEQEQTFKHNQITILESNITPIDQKDPKYEETHGLYRYGEDAVVQLDLICEYIINKNGYDEIKPKSVKELLKKPEVQPARRPARKRTKRPSKKPEERKRSSRGLGQEWEE